MDLQSFCRNYRVSQNKNTVSYRCSLPWPLQKRSKDYKGLYWCQNPVKDLHVLSVPHEPIFFEDLLRLLPSLLVFWLKFEILLFWARSSKNMDSCGELSPRMSSAGFWHDSNALLCNPWISSAMAMAMSIFRTLCVLVSLKFHS